MIKVRVKRRMEGKTDYKARMALLKSRIARLVIRKTNKYIIAQVVESKEARDFTKTYVNSKELIKFGWRFSLKNIPSCYLTGILLGKKLQKNKIKKVILDIGLARSTKESRIYAVVKGILDMGIEIPHSEKILPGEKRIFGEHIQKNKEIIAKKFNEVKNKIMKEIKEEK